MSFFELIKNAPCRICYCKPIQEKKPNCNCNCHATYEKCIEGAHYDMERVKRNLDETIKFSLTRMSDLDRQAMKEIVMKVHGDADKLDELGMADLAFLQRILKQMKDEGTVL